MRQRAAKPGSGAQVLERERLPKRRRSTNHQLEVYTSRGRFKTYLICGLYEDGRLGEVKIGQRTTGAEFRTALHAWALTTSIALQHGVPVIEIACALRGLQDASGGRIEWGDGTEDVCLSLWDAIGLLLEKEYV